MGEPDTEIQKEYDAITGSSAEETETINKRDIHWGVLEEIAALLKDEAPKEEEAEGEGQQAKDDAPVSFILLHIHQFI